MSTPQPQVKEIIEMKGTIKLKVPELLNSRNMSASDLMFGARLAPATAYRLASGDADAITFSMLSVLCDYFKVEVGDILEYIPDEESSS